MKLNLRQVEAFRAVFQTNSMTAAADLMGVTQPAVSRLIRDLEAEIDVPLFDRTGGRLLATPDAGVLYREVERSYYGLDRIVRAASQLRANRSGTLRIAASLAPSFYLLPEILTRFRDAWPGIGLSLNALQSAELLDAVAMQQYDFGIADVPSDAPGVDIEALPPLEFVCAIPAGHSLAGKAVIKPEDFDGEPFLMISQDSHQQQRILKVINAAQVDLDVVFEASNSGPICALVARGVGISVLDPLTANAFDGEGVVIRRFAPAVSYELKMVFPANRPRADRVKAFTQHVHDKLSDLATR